MTIAGAVYREGVAYSPDGALYVTPTGASSITSGTVTGTNVPYVLSKSGIPFIHLSSGSVAANGAISGITALPIAYPNAYCYFPANALATAIAAGYYYCTFSTTTAGVAFLNTYAANQDASGAPTIPGTPTAVTDGKGAFTSPTAAENFGLTVNVPAGAIGPNGFIRIAFAHHATNNANGKSPQMRFSGQAGTIYYSAALASLVTLPYWLQIHNAGVANKQYGLSSGAAAAAFTGGTAVTANSAVDTTAATTIVFSMNKATATDNAVLAGYSIEVSYGA